jgi:flagella basal body P-ring formation protein FlgA
VESNDLIVGRRLKQMVPSGEPFNIRVLEVPNVVNRNQPVTMILRNGGVEITAKATTIDAGMLGQVVDVVNIANKKRMRAKIIDQQTVEAVAF